jgi:hypothetical protein
MLVGMGEVLIVLVLVVDLDFKLYSVFYEYYIVFKVFSYSRRKMSDNRVNLVKKTTFYFGFVFLIFDLVVFFDLVVLDLGVREINLQLDTS